jgi:hypothetical protein
MARIAVLTCGAVPVIQSWLEQAVGWLLREKNQAACHIKVVKSRSPARWGGRDGAQRRGHWGAESRRC